MKKIYAFLLLLIGFSGECFLEGANGLGAEAMAQAAVDAFSTIVTKEKIAAATSVVAGGVVQGIAQIEIDPEAAQALGEQIESGMGHIAGPVARGILAGAGDGIGEGLGNLGQGMGVGLAAFGVAAAPGIGAMGEDLGVGVQELMVNMGNNVGDGLLEVIRPDGPLREGVYQMVEHLFLNHYRTFIYLSLFSSGSYFLLAHGIPFAFRRIELMLNAPKLIIESSKRSLLERIKGIFSSKPQSVALVFAAKIEKRLNKILKSVRNIHKRITKDGNKNVTYRNLMLYGAPGTGKTAFARELARKSGMQWAMMSGSSFAKFKGGEGIEALDKLFAWADNGQGLLLFIDEADSFLGKREKMDPNSMEYKILTNFLNYTGTPSKKFMIVFAANHKGNLDSAMYERIHDYVHVPLPTHEERVRILELYKKKILLNIKENGKAFVAAAAEHLNAQKIADIAVKTEGFAGRGLESLINAILVGAAVSDKGLISVEVIDEAVEEAIEKFNELNE